MLTLDGAPDVPKDCSSEATRDRREELAVVAEACGQGEPFSGRRGVEGCRFVTYSLIGERASTYLALVSKGLRPVALRRGKAPSGARGSTASLSDVDKIVWEAGPAARQPDSLSSKDTPHGVLDGTGQRFGGS